ncbi:MAG: branched-chain amino acid ABC transporter permease [Bradyrhizobium sp.]
MLAAYLQALFSGLAIGGAYGLIALSFSITYISTRTLNFSQGELISFAAFAGVTVFAWAAGSDSLAVIPKTFPAFSYPVALVLAGIVSAFVGVLLFILAVRPFAGAQNMNWVMSTIGFGAILQSLGLAVWGPAPVMIPPPVGNDVIHLWGAGVRPQEILLLVAALVIMAGLDVIKQRSRIGKAMMAVAHSPQTASLMGINVMAFMIGAFAVSGLLAGVAGVLVAPITSASLFMGMAIALKAFSAAMIGGLSNPRGCIYGGFILGVIESGVGLWQAQWREIAVFVFIILVLAIRPAGLFARPAVDKV